MKTNTDGEQNILKQMHSCTQDLTCVAYLLLFETMHLLQYSRAEADDANTSKLQANETSARKKPPHMPSMPTI